MSLFFRYCWGHSHSVKLFCTLPFFFSHFFCMKKTYSLKHRLGRKAIALASLLGLSALGAQVQGQAINYSPATATNTTSTFTALSATATTITVDNLDDSNSEPQPIGFTFNYNGQNFTQFVLNTNGVLKLGGTALSGGFNNFLTSDDPADQNLLLPFGTDLEGTASSFKVATTGSGTTRVCTIEWGNMRPFSFGAPQFTGFTFQVKLYETTNVVEFVYGPSTPGTSITFINSAFGVGLKGSGSGFSQVVLATKAVSQAWSAATFLNNSYPNPMAQRFDYDRTTLADAGRTYRFTPVTCAPPTAVTFTGTTTSSTVLNFTAPSNGTAYTIVYGARGFNPTTGTPQAVAASPYTITGLTIGTSYDLYIRSNCGATDQSVFSGPFAFRTTCATTAPVIAFPYTENFDAPHSGTLPCNITTLDVNGDSNPWINRSTVRTLFGQAPVSASNPNAMVYSYNVDTITAANDWFFTPPLLLTTGFSYQLTFKYRSSGNPAFPEKLEVKYGNAATVAGQTNTLWTNDTIVARRYITAGAASTPPVATITPSTTGLYYIGFHAYSAANRFYVAVDDLEVTATRVLSRSVVLARAVSVFPNPSSGQFTLDVRGANAKNGLQVEVVNTLGQRVHTAMVRDNAMSKLDLSHLASGMYTLKVQNGTEFSVRQVSVQK